VILGGSAAGEVRQLHDWPPIFVEGELVKRLRSLSHRAGHAELLARLVGRAPAPELFGSW